MANMSYCRFENTFLDLKDCTEHMEDTDLSPTEERYRERMLRLIKTLAIEYCALIEEEEGE